MLLKVILRSASVFDLSLRNCFRWLWRTLVQRWRQRRILISSTRSVVEVIAASVRLQRLSGESQSGGSASFPSSTGLSSNTSWPGSCFTWLLPPGFTITSSTRTGSPCLWEATLPFSSTTDPWAPGCGTANSILTISKWEIILFGQCYVDYIQRTTITWCHRYDRKDPSIVAISLSPEETLLLGFFFLPKKLYFWMTQGCTAWTFLMSGTTSATLELDSLGWDRSSRCHQTLIQGVFFNWYPP